MGARNPRILLSNPACCCLVKESTQSSSRLLHQNERQRCIANSLWQEDSGARALVNPALPNNRSLLLGSVSLPLAFFTSQWSGASLGSRQQQRHASNVSSSGSQGGLAKVKNRWPAHHHMREQAVPVTLMDEMQHDSSVARQRVQVEVESRAIE